ncbi:ankyrin repeat-containing domain protein [Coprinopsis sp. MPI-PUGE-AT-0042]|nr:ankyrin repeat-containing domain protein [Coprinopsis sp. MPI-PUGE-AT-0042]
MDGIARAFERGSLNPIPATGSSDYFGFWNSVLDNSVIERLRECRQSQMTAAEAELERELNSAIAQGNFGAIRRAYEQGADIILAILGSPEKQGMILAFAVRNAFGSLVKFLLPHSSTDLNCIGPAGAPLVEASACGDEAVVTQLLAISTVDINLADGLGRTALVKACEKGHEGIVKMLLERDDTQPNAADKDGNTPLIYTSRGGHEGIVKMLLERDDTQPNAADDHGSTPLSWASYNGHEGIVKMLLERHPAKCSRRGR